MRGWRFAMQGFIQRRLEMRKLTGEELSAVRGGERGIGTVCGFAAGAAWSAWRWFGKVPMWGTSIIAYSVLIAGTTCALDAIF